MEGVESNESTDSSSNRKNNDDNDDRREAVGVIRRTMTMDIAVVGRRALAGAVAVMMMTRVTMERMTLCCCIVM